MYFPEKIRRSVKENRSESEIAMNESQYYARDNEFGENDLAFMLYIYIYIYIYRVTHFNLGSQITRKLSPANKNVSDKSCMVSRGP